MASNPPITTAIQPPPGTLSLPHEPNTNPPIFQEAMKVRMRVFIDEHGCSPTTEIDSDNSRSWHWVLSVPTATNNSSTTSSPIAVIRLVPPPQPPHALLTHPDSPTTHSLPTYDWTHEPCIKLTRVAVVPEYRGQGLGRRLVETALEWAGQHAGDIDAAAAEVAGRCNWTGGVGRWQGLVLVHAQVEVEEMYLGMGFETDEALGRWVEEGIEHIGMFRRVEVVR